MRVVVRLAKTRRYYSPKRRAIYAKGDDIKSLDVFERAGWVCYVCKTPINKYLRLPNWYAATVEHIIPLAKGGTHTWDNVTASHAFCNFRKSDSLSDCF